MHSILVGAVASSQVALEVLGESPLTPAAVITLPLSHAGRHSDYVDLRPLARDLDIPVIECVDINAPEVLERIRRLKPALAFVIGWSQLCRREFLSLPRWGCIGFHPARLPEHRGRAVIPWTILEGHSETGATLFWMDEGMDSGDILAQACVPVAEEETARSLYDKHMQALREMLTAAIPRLSEGTAPRMPQVHSRATFCAKRTPDDGLVDWTSSAHQVWTLIRAVGDPYPGAFTFRQNHCRLVLWSADFLGTGPYTGMPGQVQAFVDGGAVVRCGDDRHVLLRTVQPEGGPRVPAGELLRIHERLGIDWLRLVNRWRLEQTA
jgi:methionyl-tRNA formyltransferase